jgi:hypothetical protein
MKDLTQIMSGFWEAHAPSRAVSSALAGNFFSCCSSPIRRHPMPVPHDSGFDGSQNSGLTAANGNSTLEEQEKRYG